MRRAVAGLITAVSVCFSVPGLAEDPVLERAGALAQEYLLVDTHIDVPFRISLNWEDVTHATESGEFDYPRAVEGGLNVPFMSIYTPASTEHDGSAYRLANVLIDQVEAIVARAPDRFAIVTSPAEALAAVESGRIGLALGMENGAPIRGDLDNLRHFHERGVRYVTLAHSQSNHISDSSYDTTRLWQGLSPFGEEVVREMNRLGIMIDVSHLSDEAAREAIMLSSVPVIASHSSVRQLTPGFERNMSDELIRLLAERDGVIMINFGSSFISAEANAYRQAYKAAETAHFKRAGISPGSPGAKAFERQYRAKQPFPYATVSQVADHIDHVVQLVGVDHVGLGSDFDGVGDSLPIGLKDVSMYPSLVAELLRRDYSDGDIEKILGANLMRVWAAVDAAAADA